jgi:hypothetical protein
MNTLTEVRCVDLSIHLWTARKKLRPSDLKNLHTGDIPPDTLASLGSKLICSPDELAVFTKLKKRAVRACETVGTRFLGGYAVPKSKLADLCTELKSIQDDFYQAKTSFLVRYQSIIDDWLQENRSWEHIIRSALTPVGEVEKKLGYEYRVYCVSEAVPDDASDQALVNDGLTSHVDSLSDTLFKEIAREANKTWDISFRGKKALTRNILRPIKTLRDKLDGLSFIDPRVYPVVEKIDSCISNLPKTGKIDGTDFTALEGLIFIMSSEEKMKKLGQGIIDANIGNLSVADPQENTADTTQNETLGSQTDDSENSDEDGVMTSVVPKKEQQQSNTVAFF